MRVEINDREELVIYSRKFDLCTTCGNTRDCPLLQALQQEIVILHYGEIEVSECGLYLKRK